MIKKITVTLISCLMLSTAFATEFNPINADFSKDYTKEGRALLKKIENKRLAAFSRDAKTNSVLPIELEYHFEANVVAPQDNVFIPRIKRNFNCTAVVISRNWLLASKGCAYSWDRDYLRERITFLPNNQYPVDDKPLIKFEVNDKFWLLRIAESTARTINGSPKAELFVSKDMPMEADYADCQLYVNRDRRYKISSMSRYDALVGLNSVNAIEQKLIVKDSFFQFAPRVGDPLFCKASSGREFLLGFMFNQLEFPLINAKDYQEIKRITADNQVLEEI